MEGPIDEKDKNETIEDKSDDKSEDKNSKVHIKKIIGKNDFFKFKQKSMDKLNEESRNKTFRCLNCFSIPFLLLNPSTHTVKLNCNQGHNNSMDIKDFLEKGYTNNFYNQICSQCKLKIDVLSERKNYYCQECNEIFCKTCIKNHNLIFNNSNSDAQNSVHHYINLDKYDTTCILHNETFGYFCKDCNINICQYCYTGKHKIHKVIDLDDITLKKKEIKKIKDYYNTEKENLMLASSLIKKIIIKIKKEIKKILEYKEAELNFKENLIKIYEKKVDNFNIIKNLKSVLFNASPFIIDNKNSYLEQLNYFYDYINNNLEKLKKDKIIVKDNSSSIINRQLKVKESNSSINSRLTTTNNENKIIKKLNSNLELNNILNDLKNEDLSKNKKKEIKIKSYDKSDNNKRKLIKKDSETSNNIICHYKKRKTYQLTNIDLLIEKKFNNQEKELKENVKKEDNKNNIILKNDDDFENVNTNLKINKIGLGDDNQAINKIKKEKIEVNLKKPKKTKIKKIIKKMKKKLIKKDNNTSESESNIENSRNSKKIDIIKENNVMSHKSQIIINKNHIEKNEEKIKDNKN